ncbi:MAG: hypothetical protein JWN04_1214 [Myxococcaceae bacterium]|nr:hypothetical protein [Myxococcaceae bacterium]
MALDPRHRVESVRFLEAQLEAVSARIRASRARPLDRVMIGELTSLRFRSTRLSRRLRLLANTQTAASEVHLLDPARELMTELGDASAEAARRGVLITLRLAELERLSRKINFIDSLASLVEDGIEAEANYLSLETRHTADSAELCLTTDAALEDDSLGIRILRAHEAALSYALRVESVECGLTRVSISMPASRHAFPRNHGAKRWSPSPGRV